MKVIIVYILALGMLFCSCKKILSPADENNRGLSDIYNDAAFAEGLLLNGYVRLPLGSYSFNDVATDDAVSNNPNNNFRLMATGNWSSINNPMDQYTGSFAAIQYLNTILNEADKVNWATSGQYTKEMFNDRVKGEAYGLRALFMYYLLQAHGGWSIDNKLLGVPILTLPLDSKSDFKLPRNTFEECVQQIYKDLDRAESYLPLDFVNIAATSDIPAKYAGKTTVADYNRVFGAYNAQRLTARIVKGVRAKLSLLAASPAFSQGTTVTWTKAADDAAAVLDGIGGISGMAANGVYWYASRNSGEINGLAAGLNPKEVLWRGNVGDGNNLEKDNYPPTLYGNGRVNPTQNLVDAFPMANGYPVTDPAGGYDPNNPYNNRDPRLALYIVVNGSKMGPGGAVIYTRIGTSNDGLNAISTSTRTGFYLRKLLREDVNLNPASTNTQRHYVPYIRYTELFLAYAEAANEAWGPDGKGTHPYSARDIIAAIRKRAGITQPDSYLLSITSKEDLRKLIHNERRLELCFEGSRFWDLRRWKENLTEAAKGVSINNNVYTVSSIENRQYADYMYYGPLPYNDVLKENLLQNKGW
ncbi:RagB/SusD domain-containing protein [Niastella koreensis GR20-10]|uniref:RagB/SusD domain-containing protein n=2 Tax=Niastella koreensis TaxID=354356 RepID=G8TM14_NIAKG|nr:RagB/SusD family nutrient uptake outer membrane protein [Niastella koreensis]AEV98774.1 RagB/SusD domain-containing protein [Niastella koreensis GR20-10]